jgi:hypothetical protein
MVGLGVKLHAFLTSVFVEVSDQLHGSVFCLLERLSRVV